jgi:hypothetical protein
VFSDGEKEVVFGHFPLLITALSLVLVIFIGIYPSVIVDFVNGVLNRFISG